MDQEQRRAYNSKNCSANKHLEFRGAVIVDSKTRDGKDYVCLDLVFSENVKIRLFNPEKSIRDRSIMSVLLSSLFEALGDDFGDIPPCRGGYHEFLSEVTETMNRRKYTMLYAKLTVNEAGYVVMGEGRCFSTEPDLEYTDSDLHFLTVDEPVKSAKQDTFMPEYESFTEEITFEEVTDAKDIVVFSSPDSASFILAEGNGESTTNIIIDAPLEGTVTVYSEVTTVNELKEVGALNGADILSIEMTDEADPVFDAVSDAPNDPVQEFLADGIVVEQEHMDTSDIVKVFDEPSDLDDIFSKPPEKAQQGYCDPEPMIMPPAEEIKEEKPKKKAPKPKIPKGADPLKYIHGDPEGDDWGPRENKIIDLQDLPQ